MAWTKAVISKYNEGPLRVHVLSLTADYATSLVATGLDVIDHFVTGKVSCTAGTNQSITPNAGATGTAMNGYLGCSGFTSGDRLFVKVYGR